MTRQFDLDEKTYGRCARLFDHAQRLLKVRIQMHQADRQLHDGDIFLLNHFARAETFIPQYCIYQETGAHCRSIASGEFFKGNDRFTQLLQNLGAVPNDDPKLLPLLAADILKGRKVIIFPEGGMVKDRQVLDDEGQFSVYSRSSGTRRKHHSGAARLAIGLQLFKLAVLHKFKNTRHRDLETWAEQLGLPSVEILLERARKPVTVIPANITFYPLRAQDNFLRRGADLVFDKLSPRAIEELIVEGNLFFKATDMDIRCGKPIRPQEHWAWWERAVTNYVAGDLPSLERVFEPEYLLENSLRKIGAKSLLRSVDTLRDRYMRDIYRTVTVNLSHLAASVILQLMTRGTREFSRHYLAQVIYIALKTLQSHAEVHLHRSLINPNLYRRLLSGDAPDLQEFLTTAVTASLLTIDGDNIVCLDKLTLDNAFDQVRLENPIEVYANEVAPITQVRSAVAAALAVAPTMDPRTIARYAFADELCVLDWDRRRFSQEKHREINAAETATADPAPYLLLPAVPRSLGVLLVHGFLSAPGETRPCGDALYAAGYPVLGVRLKGHGTSPWDLRERAWADWQQSLQQGFNILQAYCDKICVVGFSTGATLTLLHAAQHPPGLAGIAVLAPAIKFQNHSMSFVPLLHGANQLVEWVSNQEGIVPFRPNETEHPEINYRHMPIRGLYELTRGAAAAKKALPAISCPTLIIQGKEDPVIDPSSAELVFEKIASIDKRLAWVDSKRHGILYENIGGTHQLVLDFVARLAAENP